MPPSGHKPQSKDSLFAHTHGFPKEQTANRSTKPPRRSNRLPLAAFSACPSPTTFASAAPCCEPLPAPRTASSPSTDPATTSAVHPRLADMSKTSLHELTSPLLQPLTSCSLDPPPVCRRRLPPRLRLVLPVVPPPLRLGDVGPRVPLLALGQRLGLVIALVSNRLLNLLLTPCQHQVRLGFQDTTHQRRWV